MTGAVFALIANVCIATLFAGTFLALSRVDAAFRRVGWFALSYAIGALTPAAEFLVRVTPFPGLFSVLSFTTFSLAFHVTAKGLASYYRERLSPALLVGSFLASIATRIAIWDGPRDTMPYELIYQLPFAVGLGICAVVVSRVPHKHGADRLLAAMLWVVGAHFLAKPYAAMMLGSGATAKDYAQSTYALFSQALSGILLIATALAILLVVVRDMLEHARIDELSGLLNRRSFDVRCKARLARAAARVHAVVVFDLDQFKFINDTYGHAAGDEVIRAFAGVLRAKAPADAVVGRMGGEEFAVFLADGDEAAAAMVGEAIRQQIRTLPIAALPGGARVTVSVGVAESTDGEEFSLLMQRADRALYVAKGYGRDQVATAGPAGAAPTASVLAFRRASGGA